MGNAGVVRGLLALALALAVGGGCSDGSKTGAPTQAAQPAVARIQSAPVAVSATFDAGDDSGSGEPNGTWAAAVAMPAQTVCTVYPVGASNDPTRTNVIQAGADGEVRFYWPPTSWGTQLTLDCHLNGSPQGQYLVDLNNPSTFTRQSGSDLAATLVGTVPPLTGDPSAPSLNDLLRRGYPPRPDPTRQPQLYSQWLQSVSQPATLYKEVDVVALGAAPMTGPFNNETCFSNWTGFVQAAAGFSPNTFCWTNQAMSGSQLYEGYAVATEFPAFSCSGPCDTGLWAGIGGGTSEYQGEYGGISSNLLQNGFILLNNSNTQVFWQFVTPSGVGALHHAPPPVKMVAGDVVAIGGFGYNANDCPNGSFDALAPYACYVWWDYTQGTACYAEAPNPGGTWFPTTAEYVAEVPNSSYYGNAQYNTVSMQGYAIDWNGTYHYDPGNTSGPDDAYSYEQQVSGPMFSPPGVNFSVAVWQNLSMNNPVDPMYFVFQNYE